MKLKLLTAAKADVASAIAYYNAQEPGLGVDFAAEVRKTIERILQYPKAWSSVSEHIRAVKLTDSPTVSSIPRRRIWSL